MSIIATCGHKLTESEGNGTMVAILDNDRKGKVCVSYPVLCNKCLKWYGDKDLIIKYYRN